MGGTSSADDDADFGYFIMRGALAQAVSKASSEIATKGFTAHGSAALAAPAQHDRRALFGAGERTDRRQIDSGDRRGARRDGQYGVHRPLPAGRARPLHRASAGTAVRPRIRSRPPIRRSTSRSTAERRRVAPVDARARRRRHDRARDFASGMNGANIGQTCGIFVPHFEFAVDARRARVIGDALRVVEQHFGAARHDEERRQAVQVGIDRRSVRMRGRACRRDRPARPARSRRRRTSDRRRRWRGCSRRPRPDRSTARTAGRLPAADRRRRATPPASASARPPPAESPAITIDSGAMPSAINCRYAASASSSAAGKRCSGARR